ncbi:bifunctional oligoribonuclease/PAP phosphatase NrnA [Sulfurimonas sp.]|uniref:DHH family phosphoesterase n=1 Tax=Sulfurimonas sp. TaxID=2022749 RepID=UPI003561B2EF
MLSLEQINDADHIVISLPSDADDALIASANALYSFILTQHKKVSFYSECEDSKKNLSFLPWMDKLKNSYPSSADMDIKLESSKDVFSFFKSNEIKLNSKMATSLYASLIARTKGFLNNVNGITFALAYELVEAGADVDSCNRYILNYNSLASLRLKAILLKKMVLSDSGETALINLEDSDLKCSGSTLKDAKIVVKDALSLPTVNRVIVKYKNKEIFNEGDLV